MQQAEMQRLIDQHLEAEAAGNVAGCVAMYTDDVVHDVVGWPLGPMHGKDQAASFYDYLTTNVTMKDMDVTKSYFGDDFCVVEHLWSGTVPGEFLGVPGNGKEIAFRMLHVWEFKDGKMSRENVWLDGGAIIGGRASRVRRLSASQTKRARKSRTRRQLAGAENPEHSKVEHERYSPQSAPGRQPKGSPGRQAA